MTSFGAKEIREGNFMPTFKIEGQVYHLICSLLPSSGQNLDQNDFRWLYGRAIVSSRNETVNEINNLTMQKVPGEVKCYKFIDTVINIEDAVHYPQEFLNYLNPAGLPPHELSLKVGTPVMLLRNLSLPNMCNGTRLLIKERKDNFIVAKIITGPAAGESAHIPRIPMIPTDLQNQRTFQKAPISSKKIFRTNNKQITRPNIQISRN